MKILIKKFQDSECLKFWVQGLQGVRVYDSNVKRATRLSSQEIRIVVFIEFKFIFLILDNDNDYISGSNDNDSLTVFPPSKLQYLFKSSKIR